MTSSLQWVFEIEGPIQGSVSSNVDREQWTRPVVFLGSLKLQKVEVGDGWIRELFDRIGKSPLFLAQRDERQAGTAFQKLMSPWKDLHLHFFSRYLYFLLTRAGRFPWSAWRNWKQGLRWKVIGTTVQTTTTNTLVLWRSLVHIPMTNWWILCLLSSEDDFSMRSNSLMHPIVSSMDLSQRLYPIR